MAIRTTRTKVTFQAPFVLPELDGPQPPGTYDVETDEEAIEGNEHTVYVRVATLLQIRSPGCTRTVTVDRASFEAAQLRDRAADTHDRQAERQLGSRELSENPDRGHADD
jgi:hypothetical protein